jgi:predicted small lipoprotein YifL
VIVRVLTGAGVIALLAACGQRGPLILPDEVPVEVRQTRGPTPATEPAEPATKEASEPATPEVPPQAEPAPKPDEPEEEEKTGADAGKPR